MSSYKVITREGNDPSLTPYKGFIYQNLMVTLRTGNEWFKLIDEDIYYSNYKAHISFLLNQSDSKVSLALLTEDPDVCLGFCLFEGPALHYVFVKKDCRKSGIARSLIPKEFTFITHLTYRGAMLWAEKFPHVIFNPFYYSRRTS